MDIALLKYLDVLGNEAMTRIATMYEPTRPLAGFLASEKPQLPFCVPESLAGHV